jgi:hypothetical protein
MNCLSNQRLIGLLIHRGMGIPNDPLPEVLVPTHVPSIISNPEQSVPMPVVIVDLEQSNLVPTPVVKTPTVTTCKSTLNTKRKIRSTSHTA